MLRVEAMHISWREISKSHLHLPHVSRQSSQCCWAFSFLRASVETLTPGSVGIGHPHLLAASVQSGSERWIPRFIWSFLVQTSSLLTLCPPPASSMMFSSINTGHCQISSSHAEAGGRASLNRWARYDPGRRIPPVTTHLVFSGVCFAYIIFHYLHNHPTSVSQFYR